MVFYELSGDLIVSIYGAVDKKINRELKSEVKEVVLKVCKKYGSFNSEDIEVKTEELNYEKEED